MSAQSLKDVLSHWNGFARLPGTLDRPRRTQKAAADAAKILGGDMPRELSDYDLKNLYWRITQSWQRYRILPEQEQIIAGDSGWVGFFEREANKSGVAASSDLRRLPWILFYSPHETIPTQQTPAPESWLGADPTLVNHYGKWLSERKQASAIRVLLREFIRAYPAELSTFEELRVLLRNLIVESTRASLRKWGERCEQFDFLERDGNRLFVEKLLSSEDDAGETLQQTGMESILAYSHFLESGIQAYLAEAGKLLVRDQLHSDQLHRLLQILEHEGKLRFDYRNMRIAIAEALLGPFTEEHQPHELREQVEPFFMRHYGDPRLPSGKPNWAGIPDEFRSVVTRWLARQTLDAFFHLLEETALDYHWSYRKTFWMAYFDNHAILDAWFVLGTAALNIMRSLSEQEDYACGQLRGAQSNQSVLLMRMHGATVAEWSHNGSCRIWLDGNRHAPQLHREESPYWGEELRRGADFTQPHYGSPTGGWQGAIAWWLENNIGIEVSREEYLGIRKAKSRSDHRDKPGKSLETGKATKESLWKKVRWSPVKR